MFCYTLSGIRYLIVERFLSGGMRYAVKQSKLLLGEKESAYRIWTSFPFFLTVYLLLKLQFFLMEKYLRHVPLKLRGK